MAVEIKRRKEKKKKEKRVLLLNVACGKGHWTTLLSWQRIVRNETRQQRRRPQKYFFIPKFQTQIKKQINNNNNNNNNKNNNKSGGERNTAQYKEVLRFRSRTRTKTLEVFAIRLHTNKTRFFVQSP